MNEPIPLPGSGSGSTGTMPRLGLGVYQLRGEECFAACLAGLEAGYRHIDTARLYGNEEEVGRAVGVFLRRREEGSSDGCGDGRGVEGAGKSRVQREYLFLTTKVERWEGDGEKMYESVLGSVMRIAGEEEGGGYVDLILVHRPVARWRDIWSVLGRFVREGRARVLGRELVAYCQQNGIVVQAYSPLARGQRWADPVLREVVERVRRRVGVGVREDSIPVSGRRVAGTNCRNDDPRERETAEEIPVETAVTKKREITEATVTPAQVLIRWSLQRGYVPLPKSADAERIRENGDVFWFKLDEVEMGMLDGLDLGAAGALFPKNSAATGL
ncbi:2,5-diketo-D-gluconic acid reductase B [Colletotrichum costaricense]|uniref:2,5-diketo-D-gluconic acid reductase B n=1 Tax=Colletotrichum costaricense TaxID=1209916 RepID=A0AAI9Z817_9PEZI|nr:2,5-diketo-D-gluconic acid reductase B [Colletotrichum costaricense]KAK1537256.1 2,5-diketo-D-gluconic acid reductase B [Colletotrichum costaricense]